MDDETRHAQGMKVRRATLGDAYVDRAGAGTTPFTADWQDYITRTAWGDVWCRDGLDRRSRSLLVLGVTVALRHWGEFRIHVRGALNNGLTRDEVKEALMHCAVYAGVPAANHAFKEAQAVFAEIDAGS